MEIVKFTLLSLGLVLIIMLILREVACWYYKINEMLKVMKSIDKNISSLNNKISMNSSNSNNDRDQWIRDSLASNKHIKL